MPESASATGLRYKINGKWYTAVFAPVPQDTTTGGSSGEQDYTLMQYLGPNPLFFEINQKMSNEFFSLESIFPNPLKDHINIQLTTKKDCNGILSLGIINTKGQLIYQQNETVFPNANFIFNINIINLNLESGIYYLTIQFNDETISCKTVVK